jgi:hypothetical protein
MTDTIAPSAPGDAAACENCGTALAGAFCHACGQAAEPPTRSVRAFAAQAAGDLTNLDSRLLRTLGTLLGRPGRLTREYLQGRRVRYAQPLQLYLGAAAAFFFVNAYRPFLTFDPEKGSVVSSLSAVGISGTMGSEAKAGLAARGISMELFRERFEAAATGYLPAFLVGSVLLFGLVLHLFFRRRPGGYIGHAVFSLHWSAFFLLLMIVERLLPANPKGGPTVGMQDTAIALVAAGYLCIALKVVYGDSWLATAAKALGLFLIYQVLLTGWMASAIALAFTVLV